MRGVLVRACWFLALLALGGCQTLLNETYPPGSDTGPDMLNHEGEEAGTVVSGQLGVTVGNEVYVLETGDSYYFDSSQPHRFRNPVDEPCLLISATTPANFETPARGS